MNNLFVGHLAWEVTTQDLIDAFQEFGEIDVEQTKVIFDRETNRSKGFGFVQFKDAEAAKAALEKMNGATLQGSVISVDFARPKEERSGRRNFGGGNRRGGFRKSF